LNRGKNAVVILASVMNLFPGVHVLVWKVLVIELRTIMYHWKSHRIRKRSSIGMSSRRFHRVVQNDRKRTPSTQLHLIFSPVKKTVALFSAKDLKLSQTPFNNRSV
uniref:Uncharacterized protein n=1 Tax=Anopheles atroparvus TaxID=41427 RepID=A0A182IMH7_ANOAO